MTTTLLVPYIFSVGLGWNGGTGSNDARCFLFGPVTAN
jgi:hypothetical protein